MPEAAAAVERTGMEDDCSCIIFAPDIHVGRIHSVPAFKDLHRSQHGRDVSMRSPCPGQSLMGTSLNHVVYSVLMEPAWGGRLCLVSKPPNPWTGTPFVPCSNGLGLVLAFFDAH